MNNWKKSYLNLGTTFHITQKSDSGEIAPFVPCHNAIKVFLTSSIKNLKWKIGTCTVIRQIVLNWIIIENIVFFTNHVCTHWELLGKGPQLGQKPI